MSDDTPLTEHDIEILTPLSRAVRARMLLHGDVGPLLRMPLPLADEVIAASYLAYLAWIRARVPGRMLGNRPAYEARSTMGSRLRTAARRSGSLADWGRQLFERTGARVSDLRTDDALWWHETQRALAHRWRALATDAALSEVCVGMQLLDEWLRLVPVPTADAPSTEPAIISHTEPGSSHGA